MKINIEKIIKEKKVSCKTANEFLRLIQKRKDDNLFSFISSFYALKPWDENDLQSVYDFLRNSNKIDMPDIHAISITATGGELKTRTLYVTPIVSFIVAVHKPVFIQGNTAITGCGCGAFAEADIMEKLGINIIKKDAVYENVKGSGFAFLFAHYFHTLLDMYHNSRANLRFRDIFKVASSLADPPSSKNVFLCVYSEEQLKYCASVLSKRETNHSIVVTGIAGIDEASVFGKTILADIKGSNVSYMEFSSEDFGIKSCDSLSVLESYDSVEEECLEIINILKNVDTGPKFQLCILNAGIALYAADFAKSIEDGIQLALKTVSSGAAYAKYISISKSV